MKPKFRIGQTVQVNHSGNAWHGHIGKILSVEYVEEILHHYQVEVIYYDKPAEVSFYENELEPVAESNEDFLVSNAVKYWDEVSAIPDKEKMQKLKESLKESVEKHEHLLKTSETKFVQDYQQIPIVANKIDKEKRYPKFAFGDKVEIRYPEHAMDGKYGRVKSLGCYNTKLRAYLCAISIDQKMYFFSEPHIKLYSKKQKSHGTSQPELDFG
jgi:hypothetical protein